MQSTEASQHNMPLHKAHFDTNSVPLRIDNCASRSISPDPNNFITPLASEHYKRVQGLIEQVGALQTGTIQWQIKDDDGKVHTITVPDSVYVQDATSRLLSPKHWSQAIHNTKGTGCDTNGEEITLYWKLKQYKRTIHLDPDGINIATIHTAPGFSRFNAFTAQLGEENTDNLYTYDANLVSDTEDQDNQDKSQSDSDNDDSSVLLSQSREHPLVTDLNLEGPKDATTPTVIEDKKHHPPQDASAKFLQWHH
jgi:hypothetical protein